MTHRRPWYKVLYIHGDRQDAEQPGEGELDAGKLHEIMAHPVVAGEEMEAVPA